MPFGNLSEQFISESFQVLVQADISQDPVTFADGLGQSIDIVTELPSGLYSSSLQTLSNITASGDISASGTGSFSIVKATNIEGNSPLNIKGVSNLTFADPGEGVTFNNTNLFGNPIFHGDVNVYSGSAFLDEYDHEFFRSFTTGQGVGHITFGGTGIETRIQGTNIALNAPVTASGDISASGVIYAEGLEISDDATIVDNLIVSGAIFSNAQTLYLRGVQSSISGKFNSGDESGFVGITGGEQVFLGNMVYSNRVGLRGNVTASGDISASGDITANSFIGTIDGGSF